MRPLFTPSEASRVAICVGAAVLPRVSWTSAAAETGTGRHRFLERVPAVGREAALAEIEDEDVREVCGGLDLDALADVLAPGAFVAELALAWDVETGRARELGRGEGRKYEAITATEIPGTADAVALVGKDGAWVIDYKPEHGHQPSAQRHRQLRLLALMVARAFDRQWVRVQIVRPGEDGTFRSTATFDAFDLAEIAEETRALAHRVIAARIAYEQGEPPPMTLHDGCKRCPSISFCPAHRERIGALMARNETALAAFQAQAGLSAETRTAAYHALEALDAFRDAAWETLEAMAREAPIEIDAERQWGVTRENANIVTGKVAMEVVGEMYGTAEANETAEIKVTLESLKRLADRHIPKDAKRGAKGAVYREICRRIEEKGGLVTVSRPKLKVHRKPRAS